MNKIIDVTIDNGQVIYLGNYNNNIVILCNRDMPPQFEPEG